VLAWKKGGRGACGVTVNKKNIVECEKIQPLVCNQ